MHKILILFPLKGMPFVFCQLGYLAEIEERGCVSRIFMLSDLL